MCRLRTSHEEELAVLTQHAQAFTEATRHVHSQQKWCREEATVAHACARRCVEQGVVKSWTHGVLLGSLAAVVCCLRGGSAIGAILWAVAVIASCAATGASKIARWQRAHMHKRSDFRKRMAYAREAEEEAASRPDRAAAEAAAAAARVRRNYEGGSRDGASQAMTSLRGRLRHRVLAMASIQTFNRLSSMAMQTFSRFSTVLPFGATLTATVR